MKKVNIGIIGCGRVSDHYLKILGSKKINNFNLISVADENLEKLKNLEKNLDVKYLNLMRIKIFIKT